MSFQTPVFRRTLVGGYDKEQVDRLLSERDALLRLSEARLHTAETKIAELEEEVEAMRKESGEEMDRQEPGSQTSARFLTEELSSILSAAEEAATKIIERAKASTQQQIQEANRIWNEVQAEVSRFASWRERVDPAIGTTHSKMEEVKTQVLEVPERIRRALAPLAEAMGMLDADLAELGAAASPPLLLAPTGLEEAASQGGAQHDDQETWGEAGGQAAEEEGTEESPGSGMVEEAESDGVEEHDLSTSLEASSSERATGGEESGREEEETGRRRLKQRMQRASGLEPPNGTEHLPAADYLPPSLGNA
jgi:hypothetical protein